MKKFLWLYIILCWIVNYSYACTLDSTPIPEDVLRNSYELIVIASVSNITQLEKKNTEIWFSEPDTLYSFITNKVFKWDDSVEKFTIAADTQSLCGSLSFTMWEKYLLYLNQSKVDPDRYLFSPTAKSRVLHEDIDIPYDTIWEQLWYQISSTLKKLISNIQQFTLNMQQ